MLGAEAGGKRLHSLLSPKAVRRALHILTLGLPLQFALASHTLAAPAYSIATLGLTDSAHTRPDGYRYSESYHVNDLGQAAGTSSRFDESGASSGRSAWIYDGMSAFEVGLRDGEHVRSDGYNYNSIGSINALGQASGLASRFSDADADLGQTAWYFDGQSTVRLGFVDGAHTRDDGFRFSDASELTDGGVVVGSSRRFDGMNNLGATYWSFDGTELTTFGLVDDTHTRGDGYRYCALTRSGERVANAAGEVIGYTGRYIPGTSTSVGFTAWLFNGTETIPIGVYDEVHTSVDGRQESVPKELNETGQVIGFSTRYDGSWSHGRTAWLFDGNATIEIGPAGPEHIRSDGRRENAAEFLNDVGQVAGNANRYGDGNTDLGKSAWYYSGGTSQVVGFTGIGFTRSDGYSTSQVTGLSNSGFVIGESQRYTPGQTKWEGEKAWLYDGQNTIEVGLYDEQRTGGGYDRNFAVGVNASGDVLGRTEWLSAQQGGLGVSAWLYDGESTIELRLMDTMHTDADGRFNSMAYTLSETGNVAGFSRRYNGGTSSLGATAWYYDSQFDELFDFTLSVRSDGYAYSRINYVGEDGLVLGWYTLFDEFDNDLGNRAFSFTVEHGVQDLALIVDDELSNNDWSTLGIVRSVNEPGQILGNGILADMLGTQMPYLLTPLTALPGDFNGDGLVTLADYTVWRNHLGGADDALINNAGDGLPGVSTADYVVWKSHYGKIDSSPAESAPVPEPTTLSILLFFLAARPLLRHSRGHRRAG